MKSFFLRHRTGNVLAIYLIVSLVLLTVTSNSVKIDPKSAGVAVISVLQRGVAGVRGFFGRMVNSIGELRRLQENYDQLEEQLHAYRVNQRELAGLRAENLRLREQLDFSMSLQGDFVAAGVIGNDSGDFLTGILIDKGKAHGIKKNMPVVAFSGGFEGLVGRVFQVGPVSSLILPLFDVTCYVPGRMQSSRYTGLIQGGGDPLGGLTMTSVPKSARGSLGVGDLIVTSGLSSIYPKDIYVGRIREIGAKPWDTSLEIELEPIVDFSRVEYVFVLEEK